MLKAKDIMTTEVVTIQPSANIAEVIGLMKENKVHAVVVKPSKNETGYGIVTEADVAYKVIAHDKDPKSLTVRDVMTKPCIAIKPNLSVADVARLFANNHIHRAPVIEEELLGIVSVSDILQDGSWWK